MNEIEYTDDKGNPVETEPPSYVDRSLLDLDDRYYSPGDDEVRAALTAHPEAWHGELIRLDAEEANDECSG